MDTELAVLSQLEYYPLIATHSQYFPNDDFSIYRIGTNLNLVAELNGLKRSLYDVTALNGAQVRSFETSYLFAFFLRDNCWINRFLPVPNIQTPDAPRFFTICALKKRPDVDLQVTAPTGTLALEINTPVIMGPADVLSGQWTKMYDYSKHTIVAGLLA